MGRAPDDDVGLGVPASGKGSIGDPYSSKEWQAAREAGALPRGWVLVRGLDGSLWKFPEPSIGFIHGTVPAVPVETGPCLDVAPSPPLPGRWRWALVGWLVRLLYWMGNRLTGWAFGWRRRDFDDRRSVQRKGWRLGA